MARAWRVPFLWFTNTILGHPKNNIPPRLTRTPYYTVRVFLLVLGTPEGAPLMKIDSEMIGTTASAVMVCEYCQTVHILRLDLPIGFIVVNCDCGRPVAWARSVNHLKTAQELATGGTYNGR